MRKLQWAMYNALRGRNQDDTGALAWLNSAGASASAPTVLWERESECDGSGGGSSFVNNTGGTKITDKTDFVSASSGGNKSWWVLKHTGIGTQLRFSYRDDFGGTYHTLYDGWTVSTNGYGSANGGADGSATTPPTATDEQNCWATTINALGTLNQNWIGGSVNSSTVLHVWASTDGLAWRLVFMRNGYTVFMAIIEKPQNPVVLLGSPNHTWNGDDKPHVAIFMSPVADGAATRASQYAYWSANQGRFGTQMGNYSTTTLKTPTTLQFGTEEDVNNAAPVIRFGKSQLTNKFPMTPLSLINPNSGFKGRCGLLTDLWWGTDTDLGVSEGDNYPDDLTRELVALGVWVFPWNTTVMQTS